MRDQFPRAEPRRINDDINLLGPLDLKNFRNGFATARGGFPVDLVVAVAGHVLAQFFELAPFADLPLRMQAGYPAIQEQRGEIFPVAQQVRVNAQFRARRQRFAYGPESERRRALHVRGVERKLPALARHARPRQA